MKSKKVLIELVLILTFISGLAYAQNEINSIMMTPDKWEYEEGKFEFIKVNGASIIQSINGGGRIYLKGEKFKSGTISFEVNLEKGGFTGIYFRENEKRSESEHFYIRAFWPVALNNRNALQYCAEYDSVSIWDLTDEYQAPANLIKGWNKVKLVVSDHQMLVYVNDMINPSLHVPVLEGPKEAGYISFTGNGSFRNLQLENGKIGNLPNVPGYDPTTFDPNYLKTWEVSTPSPYPFGKEIMNEDLPDSTSIWKPIQAKHRGQVVLNEEFGAPENGKRRIVWLRKVINSESDQVKRLDFGFSDEVFVILNNTLLYVDKNQYGSPIMKEPKGRSSIMNTSFDVPLKKGENEILVGLTNYFYGWGLVARFDNVDGLSF